jgi:DNA-directed RNA polymerase subunit H (RpoH/RPB5)
MSINIEYNNKEVYQLIIENVLKMLERRGNIKSWEESMDNIKTDWSENIYEIVLLDKSVYSIFILNNTNTQLTTISQGILLDEYLSNNLNIRKIVIVRSIYKKAIKQILYDYKNTEFFFENEMLEDIPSKIFIPEHKLLSLSEKNELLSKFSEHELAKINVHEIMSRYYNAKVGDIFRITRPSYIAGKNIFYRRVINSSIDILFP